jgi:hypothetical protein
VHEAFRGSVTPASAKVSADQSAARPVEQAPPAPDPSVPLRTPQADVRPQEPTAAVQGVQSEEQHEMTSRPQPTPQVHTMGHAVKVDSEITSQPPLDKPQVNAPARPVPVDDMADPWPSSGPLRELTVHIPSDSSSEVIAVRFTQKGESIDVGVRSSQPQVAQVLQRELPDLVDGLKREGFRAEFAPAATAASSALSSSRAETADSESAHGDQRQAQQPDEWDERRNRKHRQPYEAENDE